MNTIQGYILEQPSLTLCLHLQWSLKKIFYFLHSLCSPITHCFTHKNSTTRISCELILSGLCMSHFILYRFDCCVIACPTNICAHLTFFVFTNIFYRYEQLSQHCGCGITSSRYEDVTHFQQTLWGKKLWMHTKYRVYVYCT